MDDPADAEPPYNSSDSETDQRQAHQAGGARPTHDYDDNEDYDCSTTIEDVELDVVTCMQCNDRSDARNDDETVARRKPPLSMHGLTKARGKAKARERAGPKTPADSNHR